MSSSYAIFSRVLLFLTEYPADMAYTLYMTRTMTLGQKVKIERATLGISQSKLAEKAGVSRQYVSDIERDSESINIGKNTLMALAEALGVSPQYLLGLSDDPLHGIMEEADEKPAGGAAPQWLAGLGKELLDTVLGLGTDDQMMLLALARRLKAASTPRIIGGED